ncbi:MAG TPA: cell division protein FtsZ [Allosphingosinicella sp.]|nr:cell division protein FtsZ [Allosphingosinicella sp.]
MINIVPTESESLRPRICVFGVGGAGVNAVETMIEEGLGGVIFVVANTDAQALNGSSADRRIQLGRKATQGLGAGSDPAVGTAAAQEAIEEIDQALEGAHMCFIAAGMGGGTGTGAAPIIAATARAKGILTVGVVTLPFSFEGRRRIGIAQDGIDELEKHVDTLIIIPNQNLFRITGPDTTFRQAFKLADAVLQQGVRGITDLMVTPGLVNLDFADIRSVMGGMGRAMMASGEASGPNRAIDAADMAIFNPLLEGEMKGARGLIISISGGEDLRLMEIDEAAGHIRDMADPEADIIWGSAIDPTLEGRIRISIVATGLEAGALREKEAADAFPKPSPHSQPSPAEPEPMKLAEASIPNTVAEASFMPAETEPNGELQISTDNLLAMFLPEQTQPTLVDRAAATLPDGGPTAGASLFHKMATLARGAAKAELYGEAVQREPEPVGPAFYNRRAGGGRG